MLYKRNFEIGFATYKTKKSALRGYFDGLAPFGRPALRELPGTITPLLRPYVDDLPTWNFRSYFGARFDRTHISQETKPPRQPPTLILVLFFLT